MRSGLHSSSTHKNGKGRVIESDDCYGLDAHIPRVAQRDDDGKKQATKGEDLKPDTMTVSREGLSSQKQEKRWSEMWKERVESEEDQGESQNAALLRMLRARRDHSVI